MSQVTNVILTTASYEHAIDAVNEFLRNADGGGHGEFIEVTKHAGGTKAMECAVYLSAFNHADTDTILRAVDQAPWEDREWVQVFVMEEDEGVFRLRYSGGSIIG